MPEERFTFFWSGPFSNWHPASFEINSVTYNCSEQFMMAEKARMFGDMNALDRIMSAVEPSDQKRYGREVKNFNREKWEEKAREIVYQGCYAKFTQNQGLKLILGLKIGVNGVEQIGLVRF